MAVTVQAWTPPEGDKQTLALNDKAVRVRSRESPAPFPLTPGALDTEASARQFEQAEETMASPGPQATFTSLCPSFTI